MEYFFPQKNLKHQYNKRPFDCTSLHQQAKIWKHEHIKRKHLSNLHHIIRKASLLFSSYYHERESVCVWVREYKKNFIQDMRMQKIRKSMLLCMHGNLNGLNQNETTKSSPWSISTEYNTSICHCLLWFILFLYNPNPNVPFKKASTEIILETEKTNQDAHPNMKLLMFISKWTSCRAPFIWQAMVIN